MRMRTMTLALATALSAVMAGGAFAADVVDREVVAPSATSNPFNWSGLYFGANGGWALTKADASFGDGAPGARDLSPDGGFVGATLGWNWQIGGMVWGVEGDYDFANLRDSHTGPGAFGGIINNQMKIDSMSSIRARLGWDMGRWMPFITGGVAFADATRTNTLSFGGPPSTTSDSNWHTGWTAGVGLEYAINQHWSLRTQYRYSDFGSQNYNVAGPGGGTNVKLTASTVDFAINMRW